MFCGSVVDVDGAGVDVDVEGTGAVRLSDSLGWCTSDRKEEEVRVSQWQNRKQGPR